MREMAVPRRYVAWVDASPWIVLVAGVGLALTMAALVMTVIMRPPLSELATLIGTLGVTSVLSLTVGFVLYRRGWTSSPSLSLTLMLTYGWAAVLTLFNVWIMARLMFVNAHDLTLAGILLIFAAIIATTFGMFVSASVTDGLRQLAVTADRLAKGDLEARAEVSGRDEVSRVARSFNAMAEQLQRAASEREELEVLRRDLIAWTSHDLRTPLTSIRVMVEALNDDVVNTEKTRRRYFRTMLVEVVELNELIDDLFELAQLEAGGLEIQMEAHSLSDLISDTLESLQPVAAHGDVVLKGEVAAGLDPVVMNASKIGRVLTNLLSNALHHSPAGTSVLLSAARTDGGVEVTVTDQGPGFAAVDLPRVFEKFYRGEQARSRSTGGSGLGLAIAAAIVEAHNGRIWAGNADGGGAVVGFEIPDADGHYIVGSGRP
jgi:signal transduction histidine kinase